MKKQKFQYIFLGIVACSFLFDACHSSKKVSKSVSVETTRTVTKNTETPVAVSREHTVPSNKSSTVKSEDTMPAENKNTEKTLESVYADKLGVSRRDITNYSLYSFINEWYGTPYKYAGHTKSGIDCSDFVSLLLADVYNINVSGAVTNIYKQCKPIKLSELREGDLVFFKINKRALSHVGIYLQNHKFVHASVHAGVMIDDLKEAYYKKYFRAAGRVLN